MTNNFLTKLRKKNTAGKMTMLYSSIISVSALSFVAFLFLKSTYPNLIVGGERPAIQNNYKIKATDGTDPNNVGFIRVFDNNHRCADNFPLGMPRTKNSELTSKSALFCYNKYAVQYNTDDKTPVWESHVLKRSDFTSGDYVERTNDFREDPHMAGKKISARPQDYTRSGYDRGHLAPAGDFAYNPTFMSESFYMSNIAPQAPNHNRQIWSRLEQSIRKLLKNNKNIQELYITTGTAYYYDKSTKWGMENGTLGYIGNQIQVPTYFYKIIIEPRTGQSAAYLIPNANNVGNQHFNNFLIKISDLEKIVNIDFNSELDNEAITAIEDNGGTLAKYLQ